MSDVSKTTDYRALLRDALKAMDDMKSRLEAAEGSRREPVAVVGIGCRLPGGSDTPEKFWEFLHNGGDGVIEVPRSRWDVDEVYDPDPDAPGKIYCRYGSFIDDVEMFDAQFFRIAPREAILMDPQQRLLLETGWEALEDAAIAPEGLAGSQTGVFVGCSTNDYSECIVDQLGFAGDAYAGTGNTASVAAGRLSYLLGLNGPSLAIDTACSSSLVALHLACQSLRDGECDAALAGGVNLMLSPSVTINFCKARMLSPDGSCKTFDASADGYVRGEGVGMVVLKRLQDATRDGDRVLGVIRSTAINQDGRSSGLTVPNGPAQEALIRQALAAAGLKPQDVDYLEAHGTGTALGDPIELGALGGVFGKARGEAGPLWVGSVKTNIGHLEAAAGITGFIKLILALRHEEIPPHLHFRQPTHHVDWKAASLRVPTEPVPWPAGSEPRVSGVSSFGFSGTNAHVVVGDVSAPQAPASTWERPRHLLALSAKTAESLASMIADYEDHLRRRGDQDFADVCYTAGVGRSRFAHRLALPAATGEEAAGLLAKARSGGSAPGVIRQEILSGEGTRVAFLFTGQGSQAVGMARELYQTQPVFRRTLDKCDELLRDQMDRPLLSVLYPEEGVSSPLDETGYTQPALFAVEYALAEMWRSWGIQPVWVMGHSVGEYVAACVAGVFSLEDGLKLIAARGRLMQALPRGGAMVALATELPRVTRALSGMEDRASIAAVNSPRQVVISGEKACLESVVSSMEADGIRAKWLTVSHAFHSPQMEPMLDAFAEVCAEVTYAKPRPGLISNVTGTIAGPEVGTPDYWRRHVREPVRFAQGMAALVAEGARTFLEVGPKPILTGLGQQCVEVEDAAWLPTLRGKQEDWVQVLKSAGHLFTRGVPIDFQGFDKGYARRKVDLPTYPFQRQRFWADMAKPHDGSGGTARPRPGDLAIAADLDQACCEIGWEPRPLGDAGEPPAEEPGSARTWVILADQGGIGEKLRVFMDAQGHTCRLIAAPEDDDAAAGEAEVEAALREAADTSDLPLGGLLHLRNLDGPPFADASPASMQRAQRIGCGSILPAIRALIALKDSVPAKMWVLTRNAQAAGGEAGAVDPAQALAWGLGRVISLEQPDRWGGVIDLSDAGEAELAALVKEIVSGRGEDQVALRGDQRYVPRLKPTEAGDGERIAVAGDATYLVTGGLGALGRDVAQWLIDRGARHLALTSRSGASTPAARHAVEEWEKAGVTVHVVQADAADPEAMDSVFEELASSGPPLGGVVHAAGVTAIAAIEDMTLDGLIDVLHAKVMGGWNLHRLTADMPLDFFVLFSSIASVWGSAGQAHYAAANHFLDLLAHYRRGRGLAATAVNWGPWSGSGMATAEARTWLSRIGVSGMAAPQALAALEACLADGAIQRTVARVDWRRFVDVYEARAPRPFLEHIAAEFDTGSGAREKSAEVMALESLAAGDQRKGVLAIVQEVVAEVLGFASPRDADIRTGLFDLGMDSLSSVEVRNLLENRVGYRLPATAAFDYPTIQKLADFLCEELFDLVSAGAVSVGRKVVGDAGSAVMEPIAVVGMAGRLPGAGGDLNRFYRLLLEGADLIKEVPGERWDIEAYYDPDPEVLGKMYCRYGAFIDDVDQFDARFFGITPREAISMDPQQRILLEVSWEALENAGLSAAALENSRTGVYIGVTATEYARIIAMSQAVAEMDAYFVSGNALNAIAGRISHALELHGPSASIDTACSSSLVTVHLACDSLRNGECDAALAGGVNLTLLPESTLATCRARMLSADGSCKTFDAAADGYVRGEGAGVVLLKRLADAQADGDRILAVIRGSAVNQDGRSSGMTVPNGVAQQRLIREALNNAGIQPGEVDYLEAHGSGTALGDPIELEALGNVFAEHGNGSDALWIASVKTNIGHLEAAAGITGLIKTVLALQGEQIPPHIHFRNPTPHVTWSEMPMRVPTEPVPWKPGAKRRIAGVSSFGFSGTNAHLVVEEAPAEPAVTADWERPRHLLALSAKSPEALDELVTAYRGRLEGDGDLSFPDVCYTAGAGRAHFNHRLALHAATTGEAITQLRLLDVGKSIPSAVRGTYAGQDPVEVAFLFTGQGSQFAGMGRELYQTQPVFRGRLDRCDELLRDKLERPLLSVLFPAEGEDSLLDETAYTQPALFSLEVALAEMWMSWGIEPGWAMGHSVGEYVAACVAGVFSLEDGLTMIAARGRLMQALPEGGAMVALMTSPAKAAAAVAGLEDKVSLAAMNGPNQVVASGERAALEGVVEALKAEKVRARWLQVSHAFHSPLMDPMLDAFAAVCEQVTYSAPRFRIISNLTGAVAGDEICSADYWCRHVRAPVRFFEGMQCLVDKGARVLLEAGPQPILIGMANQFIDEPSAVWLPSLPAKRGKRTDWDQVLASLAEVYARGASVDFAAFDRGYARRKVELPSYRFQRRHFWPEAAVSAAAVPVPGAAVVDAADPVVGLRLPLPRSKEIRFQTVLASDRPAFLDDHRLFGTVVCPGASHIATMLRGMSTGLPEGAYVLEEVYFPQALVLPDGARAAYQLALLPQEERGHYFIQAMSTDEDEADADGDLWTTHAAGKLRPATAEEAVPPELPVDVEAFQESCGSVIEGSGLYATFWKAGYTLGEAFQWVDKIYRNDWEGLIRMRVPDIHEDLGDYILHPGLIDSCLQGLAAFGKGEAIFMPGGEVIRIPYHLGRVQVYRRPEPGPLWFYGKLTRPSGSEDPVGEFILFDGDGNVIAEVAGYESRRVSKAMLLASLQEDASRWLYEVSWKERDLPAAGEDPPQQPAGSWIVFADERGVGAGLAAVLAGQGDRCALVSEGEAYEKLGDGQYRVNPLAPADFDRLYDDVLGEEGGVCRGVIHAWAVDAASAPEATGEGLERELQVSCGGALHALQAWMARNDIKPPRWVLVTRGAQPVEAQGHPLALSGSALWGLGRVLAVEHPEFGCMRIDLDPAADVEATVGQVAAELISRQRDEDQLAYRGDTRYVPRLVRRRRRSGNRLDIPADGAYRLHLSSFGVLDNLEYRAVSRRDPEAGEVEIEVETSGVNFRDVLRALGMLQEYEQVVGIQSAEDAVFGLECGGKVVAVGEGVTEYREGDAVVGLIMGSMTSHATVPVQYVAPKPASLSYEAAVASSFIMMTALRALEIGAKLQPGERILIHAAAGGVGQAAVQLAQCIGAEIFGTASQPKWAFLEEQGVQHVMNSRTLDFADQVMEATHGEGVDVVLNSLNGDYIPRSLDVLKPGGRFIEIGAIGIWEPDQVKAYREDVFYERFDMLDEEMANPGTMGRLLRDVLGRFDRGDLDTQPYTTFRGEEAIEAFRYVAQAKHIGKVMVSLGAAGEAEEEPKTRIVEDAGYLVTGGLGALGLEVASWLADQGARHLVLAGRRGAATAEAKQAVQELTEAGVQVLVSKTDVADGGQVNALLKEIRDTMPPLKGILHAAGVLADGILIEQDWDQFARVLSPKVAGGWNLAQETRDLDLDFFISFSSIASLLGSAGQGNYAAANAFLDGMAHQLQQEGRRGLSINWGPWSDVGMAAELSRQNRARWAAAGIGMIGTEAGLDVLAELLSVGGQVGAVPIEWSRLLGNLAIAPFFREFVEEAGLEVGQKSELLEKLEEAPPEKKRGILFAFVTQEVARVLGLGDQETLPLDTGFFELGVDSLTAVELRNRLQAALGTALPTTLIFNYPTLTAMIDYFADDVLELPRADEPLPADAGPPEEAGDGLDDLSMDDMVDLLKERVAEAGREEPPT